MFKLFGGSKNYAVGIDFGTSAIKIVEISYKSQKMHLENYGWVDLGLLNPASVRGETAVSESQISYNKKLQKYLERLIKSMKLKSDSAYISLPGSSGLITVIDFPDMKEEDLENAIRFEARKYIPISLDEVALDWEIIGKKTNGNDPKKENKEENQGQTEKKNNIWNVELEKLSGKGVNKGNIPDKRENNEILLVAAPRGEVIRCGNIVKESGLKVKNVELELFSLARAMVGKDPGCFLIVDIGARMTNIILVEGGTIKVNRNIEGGGNEITNVIADSLNISKQRAEELKKENKDLLSSREMSLVIPVLDMIINESIRIINAYKSKKGELGRVDGVILSGGSSKLQGIGGYFNQKTGIQTIVGNPWRKIDYDEKINPFVEKMGNSFSVALGLAFRGVEENNNKQ
ncbi:MAG: pilus assembly protein PilM [Parcubacteria group bacterium]|jgi:type IV pilus assembly protein PilM